MPYPYLDRGLDFSVTGCRLDDGTEVGIDAERATVRLADEVRSDDGDEWSRAYVEGAIEAKNDVIESVFPDSEREDPPGKLYVSIRSRETILRERADVAESPINPGTYEFEFALSRDRVRGRVELRPYLVRSESSESEDTKYATLPDARLASAKSWWVEVDPPEEVDSKQWIDGQEASFSGNDHLPSGSHLYHLDLRDAKRPKLWLNSDHPRIIDVLHNEGSVGAEARMRDVVLNEIQYAVWSRLILRTAADVRETGEPRYDWQEIVLRLFGRKLYDVEDETEAALRLREDVATPENVPLLMGRIDDALQKHVEPREQLINLMEEGLML